MTAKDRSARLEIHKMHVITLLASARIRNHWASNELLQVGVLDELTDPSAVFFHSALSASRPT